MKQIRKLTAVLSFAMLGFVGQASAQGAPDYGLPVNERAAQLLVDGALAEAKKNNWNVAIAVVDTHGTLRQFVIRDGTQLGSVEVAKKKARAAALFRRPTKAFQDALAGGNSAITALPGAFPIEGGVPVVVDGKIVGAVGVSGVTSQQDAQIAQAGIDHLLSQSKN